jgi:hypothetical protein
LEITNHRKIFFAFIIINLSLAGLLLTSFIVSKETAFKMVGDNMKYVYLNKVSITIDPFEGKKIVWLFKYSVPNTFDEDFYIYTTLFGDIERTNPRDLEDRLRRFEKLDIHPYSKEAEYAHQLSSK